MRKGRSILGLKVLSQADGTDLGTVKDLIFDHETDELLALLISDKELFGLIDAQVVPWDEVRTIGPDAIMATDTESKIRAGDYPRVKEIMERETALSGTKIYSTDGRDLGTLADMYIDEETGRVLGYEVSGGFVTDTMSGKRYMPAPHDASLGRDVMLVPPEVAADLEAQKQTEPGGLQGVASTVGDTVGTAYDTTRGTIGDAYTNIASASVEKQKAFVVGKTANRDVIIPPDKAAMTPRAEMPAADATAMGPATSAPEVMPPAAAGPLTPVSDPLATSSTHLAPGESITVSASSSAAAADVSSSGEAVEGEVLVRKGEVITQEHADRAEQSGVLHQLVLAAGGGAASQAFAAGRERVSGVVASGSTALGEAGTDVRERAARAAIGKTAGREVLAPDGSVLVAPGMTVTEDTLSLARALDKEDEVLASVGAGVATQGMQTARQEAAQGVQTVKEEAANMWDALKQKAAEFTGAAQERKAEYDVRAEQERINNALGRPTTRVILDQADNVILNTGDLITHAAIEQARAAGALDILLDSVYIADPEITPEMLRAQEPGQAALETQAEPTGGPITATVSPSSDAPPQDTPPQGSTVR